MTKALDNLLDNLEHVLASEKVLINTYVTSTGKDACRVDMYPCKKILLWKFQTQDEPIAVIKKEGNMLSYKTNGPLGEVAGRSINDLLRHKEKRYDVLESKFEYKLEY